MATAVLVNYYDKLQFDGVLILPCRTYNPATQHWMTSQASDYSSHRVTCNKLKHVPVSEKSGVRFCVHNIRNVCRNR